MISTVRKKIAINESLGTITIKQKDALSRYVELSLVDVDNITPINLYGCSVRVYVEFPDSNYIFFNGNVVDGDRGIVSFLIPSGATQNIGIFNAELCLMCSDNSRLSTYEFKIEVLSTLIDDSAIEAEPEFSALQIALNSVDNLRKEIEIALNTVGALEQELQDALSNIVDVGHGAQSSSEEIRTLEQQVQTALNAIENLQRELQATSSNINISQQETAAIEKEIDNKLDEWYYLKPLYLAEIDGYAAQSIAYIGNGIYCIGFTKCSDTVNSLIIVYNELTKTIIGSAEGQFGHINSLGYDGEYLYVPNDAGTAINRFKVNVLSNGITITTISPLTLDANTTIWSVFDYNNEIYIFGEKGGSRCFWRLNNASVRINVTLPVEKPRTGQSWATDGKYLYWLSSNPNAVAIFDFSTGEFIRWSEIGDFVGGVMMLGEVEMMCFAGGRAKIISQYYYPNSISHNKRYWLFSDMLWSKHIPAEQQHWYPNAARNIYVSNEYPQGVSIRTNKGLTYPAEQQTGTQNYPYPSLETALYAAMATPNNQTKIIMMSTNHNYVIDDLVLRLPTSLSIECLGQVTFTHLHLPYGNLTITGNARFEKISTTPRSQLQIIGGTFTASGRNNDEAPYSLAGTISIVGAKYIGGSDEQIFDFAAGANGVVGFITEDIGCTAPRSNNIQQLNLTLLNVLNGGYRERWTPIYSGDAPIIIGSAVPTVLPDFYVNDNVVVRIKWRSESDEYYNTITHVNGDTIVDLTTMIGSGVNTKYRVIKIRLRPRKYDSQNDAWIDGDIRVMSLTDYSIIEGLLTSTVANSDILPQGLEIKEISVRGY